MGSPVEPEVYIHNATSSDIVGAVKPTLKLQPGAPFTRDVLGEDVNRVRQALIAKSYLAPQLEDPEVRFDSEKNEINISLEGSVGPRVDVTFEHYTLSEKKQLQLLPIKREGNIDVSVLEEGARRVRNQLQEQGYFFSEVTPLCTVTPPTKSTVDNGTNETCQNLNPAELNDHTVKVVYDVTLNRRLKLTDIRITGTNKLTFADVEPELKSKKASAFAFIPFLGGYGRGFTSNALLEEDRRTIESHMRDFGYRRAHATVLQGISPTQDNLIITFNVDEGPLTRIAEIDIQGETALTRDRLSKEITIVKDAPYSRSQVRADNDRLLNLYAREGYIEAEVRPSVDDLPKKGEDEQVRVVFNVIKEGAKAIVNDIIDRVRQRHLAGVRSGARGGERRPARAGVLDGRAAVGRDSSPGSGHVCRRLVLQDGGQPCDGQRADDVLQGARQRRHPAHQVARRAVEQIAALAPGQDREVAVLLLALPGLLVEPRARGHVGLDPEDGLDPVPEAGLVEAVEPGARALARR